MEFDFDKLLKDFQEIVTVSVTESNRQLSQKLDNVLSRLFEIEKSIIQLESHRNNSTKEITELTNRYTSLEQRLKDSEKQLLTIQVQGQGFSRVGTSLWGVLSSIVVGVILWVITKK